MLKPELCRAVAARAFALTGDPACRPSPGVLFLRPHIKITTNAAIASIAGITNAASVLAVIAIVMAAEFAGFPEVFGQSDR